MRQALAPVGAVVSALWVVISFILDGKDIKDLGWPLWAWQTVGAAVFFLCIFAVVYGYYKTRTHPSVQVVPGDTAELPKNLGTTPVPECTREHIMPEQQRMLNSWPEDHRLAGIYSTLVNDENENLQSRIHIHQSAIDFTGLKAHHEPFIDFVFVVYSGSPHTLDIEGGIAGRVRYEGYPLIQAPILEDTIRDLRHAQLKILRIRQGLSPETGLSLVANKGKEISFATSLIQLSVRSTTRDGEKGASCQFPFPTDVRGIVPEDVPNEPWMGMQLA